MGVLLIVGSDIHIEPADKELRVRYRIDGQLHDLFRLPKKNQNAILARIKIISGLDIRGVRFPPLNQCNSALI